MLAHCAPALTGRQTVCLRSQRSSSHERYARLSRLARLAARCLHSSPRPIACLSVSRTQHSIALTWTTAGSDFVRRADAAARRVFYAAAALVLLRRRECAAFLLRPRCPSSPSFAAAALYFLASAIDRRHAAGHRSRMILEKLHTFDLQRLLTSAAHRPARNRPALPTCQCALRVFLARREPSMSEARPHDASVAICTSITYIDYLPSGFRRPESRCHATVSARRLPDRARAFKTKRRRRRS